MRKFAKPLVLVAVIGLLVWASYALDLSRFLSVEAMRGLVHSYGAFGPLIFIGVCVAGVLLHLPEIVLLALGGVLFGFWQGLLFGWLGAMLGASAAFLLVRYGARDALQRSVAGSKRLQAIDDHLARHGFITVLFLRMILLFAPPLNWIIALSRVSFANYVAGSAIGVIPGIALTCYFANSLVHVQSASDLLQREFLLPAALVFGFFGISAVVGFRLLGKKGAKEGATST